MTAASAVNRLRNPGEKRRRMAALAIERAAMCCDTCDHQFARYLFGCQALDAWARTGGRPYPCHNLELWTARRNGAGGAGTEA